MLPFVIDAVLVALLVATIVFALRLEGRLKSLRDTRNDLMGVIAELNAAAARAERGIQGLKFTAETAGTALDDRLKRARSLGDELEMLVQSGNRIAQRFDAPRPTYAAHQPAAPAPNISRAQAQADSTRRELMRALSATR